MRVRLREWDTNDFARELSRRLGASRERVAWAGTKDKHAHTTQLFSVRDADPAAIPAIADAAVDVLGRLGRPLSFGDLAGNAFRIRVRETDGSPAAITDDLRRWWRSDVENASRGRGESRDNDDAWDTDETHDTHDTTDERGREDTLDDPATPAGAAIVTDASGDGPDEWFDDAGRDPSFDADAGRETTRVAVPNWYGHQRFGSRRPVTHEVGFRIVAGDPRGAVVTYAGNPFETEPDASREGRRVVDREAANDDPDWAAARDALPGHLRFERAMLSRLIERKTEEDGRDSGTSDDDRDSTADDERWWHALDALPESLRRLFVNAAQSAMFNRVLSERSERGLPFDRPVEGDVVCFRADADRVARPDPDRTTRATSERLGVLERHCERGRAFVTAPVIGHETELADGEPGEIERAVLRDAGVEPADFDVREPYNASGTRRALLVGCDLSVARADDDLVFRFALPSGAYATALLREYLQTTPDRL